jgi:hypothetical protein
MQPRLMAGKEARQLIGRHDEINHGNHDKNDAEQICDESHGSDLDEGGLRKRHGAKHNDIAAPMGMGRPELVAVAGALVNEPPAAQARFARPVQQQRTRPVAAHAL